MKTRILLSLLFLLASFPFLTSSSCESDPTEPGGNDTDAPLVVQVTPAQDGTDVAVDAAVTITFNEAMAAGSAAGNVSMSAGAVTATSWTDNKTLQVTHGDWPAGTQVTVTAGTGLTDAAGNGLASAFAWSFWTATDALILQNHLPTNSATEVPINSTVWLQFSRDMNHASLSSAVTVTSPDKATHTFTVAGMGNEATMTFDADLPADKLITVAISVAAQAHDGTPLAAATSFSFTTGSTADDTPPQLLSIEPVDGSVIPTSAEFVRLTFDEAIDDDSLTPTFVSGQFMLSLTATEGVGVWTENYTVITIGLDTPLIPGSIFRVVFESYADVYGNVNTTGFTWEVTVAGTAVEFPLENAWLMVYEGTWWVGGVDIGSPYHLITKYEEKTNDEWWRWDISAMESGPKAEFDFTNYDRLKLTSTGIQFLGFHKGNEPPEEDFDLAFNPAVELLRLPLTTGGWSGVSLFDPAPPAGQANRVEYEIAVLEGTVDVLGPEFGDKDTPVETRLVWPDCRRVIMQYDLTDGETTYEANRDSMWISPGMGIVRKWTENVEGEAMPRYTNGVLYMAGFEDEFPDD